MSTKFELPFDTCFACFQKSDDNCSCKSRKIYEQGKADGAREFAEYLDNNGYYVSKTIWNDCGHVEDYHGVYDALAEWQKGKENESK